MSGLPSVRIARRYIAGPCLRTSDPIDEVHCHHYREKQAGTGYAATIWRYVYFERWDTGDTSAVRIRISDRKQERIGSLKEFRRTLGPERCWSGLAPDDALLVLRDIGRQEVYAFDWEAR